MGDGIQRPVSSHFVILEEHMINKEPLVCHRIRKIEGSFGVFAYLPGSATVF